MAKFKIEGYLDGERRQVTVEASNQRDAIAKILSRHPTFIIDDAPAATTPPQNQQEPLTKEEFRQGVNAIINHLNAMRSEGVPIRDSISLGFYISIGMLLMQLFLLFCFTIVMVVF